MEATYDPDVIHECSRCGRSYSIRPVENMNKWNFYSTFCSAWCAMPAERQQQYRFMPTSEEATFLFLLDQAKILYRSLLRQVSNHGRVIEPSYWYGWLYRDTHPYRFASEFMDRTERSLFLSKHEREKYARYLFALTNQMYYGADDL